MGSELDPGLDPLDHWTRAQSQWLTVRGRFWHVASGQNHAH